MNGYSMSWANGYHQWCIYHWLGQLPGRGDGSDGRARQPELPGDAGAAGSKGPNVNQDSEVRLGPRPGTHRLEQVRAAEVTGGPAAQGSNEC